LTAGQTTTADFTGDGSIDVGDLVYMIQHGTP
jgi:hypothetical protein